jgi:hypothetical protein
MAKLSYGGGCREDVFYHESRIKDEVFGGGELSNYVRWSEAESNII